ncbi:MAG: erythromycin esterase family protein, partial [Proteobacteria bacterium]
AANAWLAGGEGDLESVISSFGQGIWLKQEFLDLLQWMRGYNVVR